MNRHRRRAPSTVQRSLVVLLGVAATVTAVAGAAPSYHVLLGPPPVGQPSTFASDLFAKGTIVGYAGSDAFDPLAEPFVYRFDSDTLVPLNEPTDSLNFPLGGARPGLVAGSSSNFPYVWRRGVPIPLRPAGGLSPGFAYDAMESGAVCGAVFNDFTGIQYPAYWPSPVEDGVLLPGLNGIVEGAAFAFNESGQIGGVVGGVGVFYGARWDGPDQTPIQIGPLPGGVNSEIVALNSRGDAAGRSGFLYGEVQAMAYFDDTAEVVGLGYLDGTYSYANAINDARQVVGTSSAGAVVHAFLWQENLLYDLNDLVVSSSEPFEYLSNAVAIDNGGRIAAEAVVSTPTGEATRVALLTPIAGSR